MLFFPLSFFRAILETRWRSRSFANEHSVVAPTGHIVVIIALTWPPKNVTLDTDLLEHLLAVLRSDAACATLPRSWALVTETTERHVFSFQPILFWSVKQRQEAEQRRTSHSRGPASLFSPRQEAEAITSSAPSLRPVLRRFIAVLCHVSCTFSVPHNSPAQSLDGMLSASVAFHRSLNSSGKIKPAWMRFLMFHFFHATQRATLEEKCGEVGFICV